MTTMPEQLQAMLRDSPGVERDGSAGRTRFTLLLAGVTAVLAVLLASTHGVPASPALWGWSPMELIGLTIVVGDIAWLGYVHGGQTQHEAANGATARLFPSLDEAGEDIAREINRARRFERPLSVVLLRPESAANERGDLLAQLSKVGLRETDIWAYDRRSRQIVGLIPECGREEAQLLVNRLADDLPVQESLKTYYSIATFPEDALAFDVLLQRARHELDGELLITATRVRAHGDGQEGELVNHAA